jgi:hypothetical protein
MSVLASRKDDHHLCSCGCNRLVSRSTEWRYKHRCRSLPVQPESPPPPKRCRIALSQAESPIIAPDKQKWSRTDNISSGSHSCVDASNHPQIFSPQLHTSSFDDIDPSLPSPDPSPAPNLLQPPGDALTEASGLSIDDFLRNLATRTHQTTDQSDDEDSEGDPAEDLEAGDYVDHESDDFQNGEDSAMEGDADPHEGIVSDWDLLAEKFIVEAEELGNFWHSLLHIS